MEQPSRAEQWGRNGLQNQFPTSIHADDTLQLLLRSSLPFRALGRAGARRRRKLLWYDLLWRSQQRGHGFQDQLPAAIHVDDATHLRIPGGRGQPNAGLIQATDGNLYGTTYSGGVNNSCGPYFPGCGTAFKITAGGQLTTLHSFDGTDGEYPDGGLLQADNGSLYGTTSQGGSSGYGTVYSLTGPSPTPVQFVPVTPCRLVDTRKVSGGSGPIQGGTFEFFDLPQTPQKAKNCPTLDLSSAAAYSLNVTVVPQGPLGYLTVWPAGRSQPNVSTLNSVNGRVKANAAIIPAGAEPGDQRIRQQHDQCSARYRRILHYSVSTDLAVLSADALPGGGHARIQRVSSGPGPAALDGRGGARFPDLKDHVPGDYWRTCRLTPSISQSYPIQPRAIHWAIWKYGRRARSRRVRCLR